MSFSLVRTRTLIGTFAPQVQVETHLANGLPSFTIVGLAETAVKESRDRVRSAIINSNFTFPSRKITVNLAPADLPKEGAKFDLPIAIGILMASEQIRVKQETLDQYEFIGELALNGLLRRVSGILPIAYSVSVENRKLALPEAGIDEAAVIKNLNLLYSSSLNGLIEKLITNDVIQCEKIKTKQHATVHYADFADVKGQFIAKRAVEIAASGRHNLLMMGPPGCGKTMLASRIAGILPKLTQQQAIEVASIESICSQGFDIKNWRRTPYRSPHHSCSAAALIGGGSKPIPGEISLAHHGILFLDELTEFDTRALEMLREPLETGYVNIARVNRSQQFLSEFMLIAAANPCRCGYYGSDIKPCRCSVGLIERYRNKLSGPLIDRFDMHIELSALNPNELIDMEYGESSAEIAFRINRTRQIQWQRQNKLNCHLDSGEIQNIASNQPKLMHYLVNISNKLKLTARSFHRILRVARTIADISQSVKIQRIHINEALQYRVLDRESS